MSTNPGSVCTVLYCIVLYCIVLYCIVLYCIVLYCIVLYCIVMLQACMARGIYGLPKVSPGPAMPNPSTPFGRATHETASRPFWGGRPAACGRLLPPWIPHAFIDSLVAQGLLVLCGCNLGLFLLELMFAFPAMVFRIACFEFSFLLLMSKLSCDGVTSTDAEP
jgi:hypothetical protein